MPSAIHLRLLGYSVTLVVHTATGLDVLARLAVTTKDPTVADFATLQHKFITIWLFLLQMTYTILGLSCDLLNLGIATRKSEPKLMNRIRETAFSSIIWPISCLVPAVFWPIHLYDDHLLLPTFIDKILSGSNNQVMHTYVIFFALWELIFLKRSERNHKLNSSILAGFVAMYLWVFFKSYTERGTFIYPICDKLYGTVYFPLFLIVIIILTSFFYCIQWSLTSFVWDFRQNSDKKMH